jgi:hypothetical protein
VPPRARYDNAAPDIQGVAAAAVAQHMLTLMLQPWLSSKANTQTGKYSGAYTAKPTSPARACRAATSL